MSESNRIYIECYDANGFYEENYERIMLIMEKLTNSTFVKREWVSSQAVGGSWARSIRCVFDTNVESHMIKRFMMGLEYCDLDSVPEKLHPAKATSIFRFADIDVIEASGKSRIASRLKLGHKKISSGEVRDGNSDVDFILACRKDLLQSLGKDTRQKLLNAEKGIFEKLLRSAPF
ncbi:MAG: hypothetical protein ACFFEF_05235 [Candidatus Thorarchaeota archaeon]